jgi:hypothetical protein
MRARCKIAHNKEGLADPELTVGMFYVVNDTDLPAMAMDATESYVTVVGNSGVEVLRPKHQFTFFKQEKSK